jgi:hypothetical protein
MNMSQEDFIKGIQETYTTGVEIIRKKNSDYAGNGDPWKNFKTAELVGIDYKRAILVRVTDKLSRISNLLDKDPQVVEESVADTLIDTINYLAILMEAIKHEKNSQTHSDTV